MTISPLRIALLVLLASLIGYVIFDHVADQRDVARRERDSAVTERDGLREAARISGEMLAARDLVDQKHTQELNDAKSQIDGLQRDVADGRKRLSVRATCKPAVPANSGAASVADAATAELAADAGPDYFTLLGQLALSKQMILGLQDHIRHVVQRTPATTANPQMETPE